MATDPDLDRRLDQLTAAELDELLSINELRRTLDRLNTTLTQIATRQETIMANLENLNAAVDGLGTALANAVERINADFQALKDQIARDATDQTAVDAATSRLQASVDALNAIDPDPNNPTPTV